MSDRSDILEIIARSADATTRRDEELFASLWTETGTWVLDKPLDATITGTAAEIASALVSGMTHGWASFLQLAHQTTTQIEGDTANTRTYISEQGVMHDGTGQRLHGVYEDQLVRTPEGWRFSQRHFRYLYLENETIPGVSAPGGTLALPESGAAED